MDQHDVRIHNIQDLFIKMNKGTVTKESIKMICDKHKQILKEIDYAYHYMKSLNITDALIKKKDDVYNTILLWRKLNLKVVKKVKITVIESAIKQ